MQRNEPAQSLVAQWNAAQTPLIPNLRAEMAVVTRGERAFPLTLANRQDQPNCYLISPTTAYRDYGIEETRHFAGSPMLRGAMIGLLRSTGPLLRATGLDHQAQLNNWLLATNPPCGLQPTELVALMDDLAMQFPDRAIVIRSLNDRLDPDLLLPAPRAGLVLLPARQVWLLEPGQTRWPNDRRRDARLLARSPLQIIASHSFTDADFAIASQLYGLLYVQKYTPLNPHYSAACLQALHQAGFLHLTGLRQGDDLLGVIGTVAMGGVLTAPVVGYRTDLPQSLGLYRQLIALAMAEAESKAIPFNMSAGAATFKRLRGAIPAIEYTLVKVSHLPLEQRLATGILAVLLNRLGIPIMRKYSL